MLALASACGDGSKEAQTPTPLPREPAVASTLVVNSARDIDSRDDELTLREAILLATGGLRLSELTERERAQVEGEPGESSADSIRFAEGIGDTEGAITITLSEPLPDLSSGFDTIEGEGRVTIDGAQGGFPCLQIRSLGNRVWGLFVRGCQSAVVLAQEARENLIGGPEEGQGNVFSGNTVGVEVRGRENIIQGNVIGLDPAGKEALPNEFEGIWLAPGAKDNRIGGSNPDEGNVISGNALFGISIDGEGTTGNEVLGNLIGTDPTGTLDIPNKYGVVIQRGASGNTVGGREKGAANVISGNNTGILLRDAGTSGNVIEGNYIGFAADGETELPNVVSVWISADVATDQLGENKITGRVEQEGRIPISTP